MAVKIGHAVMDENGGITGPISGDQTGKEVRLDKWYAKNSKGVGWSHYIELKDATKREQLARFIEAACANPQIGYSQKNRTALYNSMKAGRPVDVASGDVDCTSLIFIGLKLACGISVAIGYSGNMAALLKATGQFKIYTDAAHLSTDKLAKRGGIYLRIGHALTVLENGSGVGVVSDPLEGVAYVVSIGTLNVRNGNGTTFTSIGKTKNGERLEYLDREAEKPNWYRVIFRGTPAWVTSKSRYTRLVE